MKQLAEQHRDKDELSVINKRPFKKIIKIGHENLKSLVT